MRSKKNDRVRQSTLDDYMSKKRISLSENSLLRKLGFDEKDVHIILSYIEKRREKLDFMDLAERLGVHSTLTLPILKDLIKHKLLELDEYVTFYIYRRMETWQ